MLQNFLNKQLALADLIKSDDETKGTVEFYYYDNTTPTVPSSIKINRCGNCAKVWAVAKPKDGYKIKQWSDQTTYADSNNRLISKVTKNLDLSVSFTEAAITGDYLTFTNESSSSSINMYVSGVYNDQTCAISNINDNLYYNVDNKGWTSLNTASYSATLPFKSTIKFKGTIRRDRTQLSYLHFSCNNSFSVSGVITSIYTNNNNIVFLEDIESDINTYYFLSCFDAKGNNTLVSAKDLILAKSNGTKDINGAYMNLFHSQTNLLYAPKIPDIIKSSASYQLYNYMFSLCNNLKYIVSEISNTSYVATQHTSDWMLLAGNNADNPKFYNLGGATFTRNESGVPSNWTILTSLDEG